MPIQRYIVLLLTVLCLHAAYGATYEGRVVDEKGAPIPYATVYPEIAPEWGTATNNDGYFSFEANLLPEMKVVVSYIGYEKITVNGERLAVNGDNVPVIVLKEQPIALQETVVAAKASKQRNKRKQMAALLYSVYRKIEEDFPDDNTLYQVVSDVRMQGENATWGMEQMIANIVVLPEAGHEGRDSVQFQGTYCKRFFDAQKRAHADSILASDMIERMEKRQKEKVARKALNAVDSGVVVHRALFGMGNMRYDFEQAMTDTRHWTEGETVLTHTETISKYLGCFKMTFQRHYIVDSETYAVRRFAEHADVKVVIPFGYKLNADQLDMLNLFNMDERRVEKFRLKRMNSAIDLNTIYQRVDGHVYTLEKNMIVNGHIIGSKDAEVPLHIKATQRVTDVQTKGIQPLTSKQITHRVKREIVEIY